jgi:chromosomal replication initiator protein
VKEGLDGQSYNNWFKNTKVIAYFENTMVVEVPNSFVKYWLTEHYANSIKEFIEKSLGREVNIDIVISPGGENSSSESSLSGDGEPSMFNPKYTFDTFVVGPSNRFAHAASLAVAESPAKSYNPLFIYGGVGLGKTHLLHAIGYRVLQNNPKLKVVYISSEKFTNELINSIVKHTTIDFRNKYRKIDVLLIDDIQFIAGKESTQEEFFHTFNALYDDHKQIVISSDSPPKDIPTIEERLRSRFEMGLIADIQLPDLETRVAILRKKAETEGISIPDEVSLFIANKVKSNIRELEGLLIRITAFASLTGSEVTKDLADKVLRGVLPREDKKISVDTIMEVVAGHFSLQVSDMTSKRKTKDIAFPRQVAMYLIRNLTGLSLPNIGDIFGGRDHTTIMHACDKIQELQKQDAEFNKLIRDLTQKIREKS